MYYPPFLASSILSFTPNFWRGYQEAYVSGTTIIHLAMQYLRFKITSIILEGGKTIASNFAVLKRMCRKHWSSQHHNPQPPSQSTESRIKTFSLGTFWTLISEAIRFTSIGPHLIYSLVQVHLNWAPSHIQSCRIISLTVFLCWPPLHFPCKVILEL